MPEKPEETYYVFKSRHNVDFVTISRHDVPDFCAGMSEEEILKNFRRKEIKI